jgi:hypothetical protein
MLLAELLATGTLEMFPLRIRILLQNLPENGLEAP